MGKETQKDSANDGAISGSSSPIKSDSSRVSTSSQLSIERELGLPTCRVCQCVESDKRGDIVLGFLGINPPPLKHHDSNDEPKTKEFVGPTGEVFVCTPDVEMGGSRDTLIELGCSCKDDLALVHYACALKWFVNHGSTVCEICGSLSTNVKTDDFKKVLASLKEYETLRDRTASGAPNPARVQDNNPSVDPDAVAAIRRQRLSEIYSWFNPQNTSHQNNNTSNRNGPPPTAAASLAITRNGQVSNFFVEESAAPQSAATRWAVEGTGILLATGLLTVILAWLIAPRVGKRTANYGLHILLGGVCALALVIFFRFFVLTRIRYGPARYWAILFVFWFLVFGIWASRTHSTHGT